jgi:molybdopterin-synthase adenylyltransferase
MTTLSDDELERYARHIVLREIGGAGQVALKAAHVTVIGAGGIGVPVLQYLAAAGVGRLTIIDDDVVSLSNLQRQVLYGVADIGIGKAERAAVRIAEINPGVAVDVIEQRIDATNAPTLLQGDVIVDGSDNFATRLAVADAAFALRIPLVSAAIGQFHGQLGTFRGWEPDAPCYRCYVGDAHDADDCDTCAELGVLGAMTGMMGSLAALEGIRCIHPFGETQAGKLHIIDGLVPSMRAIRLPKDPACRTCGAA